MRIRDSPLAHRLVSPRPRVPGADPGRALRASSASSSTPRASRGRPVTGRRRRRPPPLAARARQRPRPAAVLSRDRRGDPGGSADHAGGGMARRQLPHRRTSSCARSATTCPRGFYRELPKLAEGPLAGYPRVYGIAWAFVAHTDSRFDPETLRRFVRAYQRVQPLTIGELWAVADHAARRAGREPPAPGRGHRARPRGAPARPTRWPTSCSGSADGRRGAAPRLRSGSRRPAVAAPSPCSSSSGCAIRTPRSTPALRWLDERLAGAGHDAPTRSCASSTSGRPR